MIRVHTCSCAFSRLNTGFWTHLHPFSISLHAILWLNFAARMTFSITLVSELFWCHMRRCRAHFRLFTSEAAAVFISIVIRVDVVSYWCRHKNILDTVWLSCEECICADVTPSRQRRQISFDTISCAYECVLSGRLIGCKYLWCIKGIV